MRLSLEGIGLAAVAVASMGGCFGFFDEPCPQKVPPAHVTGIFKPSPSAPSVGDALGLPEYSTLKILKLEALSDDVFMVHYEYLGKAFVERWVPWHVAKPNVVEQWDDKDGGSE